MKRNAERVPIYQELSETLRASCLKIESEFALKRSKRTLRKVLRKLGTSPRIQHLIDTYERSE